MEQATTALGLGCSERRPRHRKTAQARRLQGRRAEARVVQKLLAAFHAVQSRRGNALGTRALALASALAAHVHRLEQQAAHVHRLEQQAQDRHAASGRAVLGMPLWMHP